MKVNNKGMTLIEITVVLVISSIIMLVAGTIILNGFGYFDKTAVADRDKYAVDTIASLVRDELIYSTDVRVEKEQPPGDDWHVIDVSGEKETDKNNIGRLQKDNNYLYNNDFYQNRTLQIEAKLYQNDYRLDLSYAFIDHEKEEVYKTSSTLELLNLKSSLINNNTKYDKVDISKEYKIYYRTSTTRYVDDPNTGEDGDHTGTVEDEINCRTKDNTVVWEEGKKDYPKGSFVEYPKDSKKWYRAIKNIKKASRPDENPDNNWKNLSAYWVEKSSYEKGDVVEYPKDSSFYYQCLQTHDKNKNPQSSNAFWKLLNSAELEAIKKEHSSADYCTVKKEEDYTVGGEATRCTVDNPIIEWEKGASVARGGYVSYEGKIYRYINAGPLYFDTAHIPNVNNPANWKLIETQWNPNSIYGINDIVSYDGDVYYQLKWPSHFEGGNPPPLNTNNWTIGYNSIEELIEATKGLPTCDVKP